MKARKLIVAALVAATAAIAGQAQAAGDTAPLKTQKWSWKGIFGVYDTNQLRRGFQVYQEVCANCHGLKFVAYRNLADLGYSADEIKEIAAQREVLAGPNEQGEILDENGDLFTRPAAAHDPFVNPYRNEGEAKAANGGAVPPDLSLMAKARKGGPDYIFSLLTGYTEDIPFDVTVTPGKYYNEYFPGHMIGMPPPLFEDLVTYEDGTQASVDQMARDITAFLNWAAEPELNDRHSLGLKVMLFLIVFTAFLYALKRRIWEDVEH